MQGAGASLRRAHRAAWTPHCRSCTRWGKGEQEKHGGLSNSEPRLGPSNHSPWMPQLPGVCTGSAPMPGQVGPSVHGGHLGVPHAARAQLPGPGAVAHAVSQRIRQTGPLGALSPQLSLPLPRSPQTLLKFITSSPHPPCILLFHILSPVTTLGYMQTRSNTAQVTPSERVEKRKN